MSTLHECPRCGYDQSGAIAAWERNEPACCPLEGLCSECGLAFAWRDLLNPVFTRQVRMFEHAKSRVLASFAMTLWRSFRPWSFWRWMRMEFSIDRGRVVRFAVFGAALNFAAAMLFVFTARAGHRLLEARWTGLRFTNVAWSDQFALSRLTRPPFEILYDRDTRGPAPWVVVLILGVVITPWTYSLLPATLRRARVRRAHLLRVWAYGLAWLPFLLVAPALAASLADSATEVDVHLRGAGYWLSGLGVWLDKHRYAPGMVSMFVWLASWWGIASSRYLRLPHGPAIGVCMAAITMLIAIGLVAILRAGARWLVWDL